MLNRSAFRTVTLLTAGVCTGGTIATVVGQDAAAAKPVEEKKPLWETSANVGVTLTRGNSENFLATAGINTQRKWTKDEIIAGATAGYGENTDQETGAESTTDAFAKGFGQYNHLFTERFYGALRLDALNDSIADVHYRVSVAPLAGYYFIKKPNTTLSGDVGPSWVIEKVGDAGPRGYLGVRAGERFEYKFKGGARVWQSFDITPEVENWENYVANAEIGVEAPITKKLAARAVLQDTYDHQPSPGREKNDLKLIAGLAYKF